VTAPAPLSGLPAVLAASRNLTTAALTSARDVGLVLLPHGGQSRARRNAWQSLSEDVARARLRRETRDALQRAHVAASPGPLPLPRSGAAAAPSRAAAHRG